MTAEVVNSRIRRFLLLLAIFALLAMLTELFLAEHTKETLQFIPFILCGAGLIALTAVLLSPQKSTLIFLRVVMTLVALGGLVGTGIHLLRNFEFEQEIRPSAAIGDILLPALKGAAPLLAPGTLVFAALLALAATYHHPALESSE
ncbi:MAG TPA: hypothetical protein VJ183_03710 [Chloroflexia bacterium]|nr:hypothetical protein [Chloroflexia bacterium]